MSENKEITIVTHDTGYHADDVFAVATLLLLLGDTPVKIVRSRDEDVVSAGDYVVDVGKTYDPLLKRFDHHQSGGAGMRENGIPYASFGLVWKEYGEKISGSKQIADRIDVKLVQSIDAGDNAVASYETKFPGIYPYTVGMYFDAFTPTWKEEGVNVDIVFIQMVTIAKELLLREISKETDKLEAFEVVKKVYEESGDKRLVIFDKQYPAREFLASYPEPLYFAYPRKDGKWALKTILKDSQAFVDRKPFPKHWEGKEGKDLEEATGVTGSVFCLRTGFLIVADSREAIVKLAEIAVNS